MSTPAVMSAQDALDVLYSAEAGADEAMAAYTRLEEALTLVAGLSADVTRLEQEAFDRGVEAGEIGADQNWHTGYNKGYAATEAQVAELRSALGAFLSYPRFLSIGGINTDVEVRVSRHRYEEASALLARPPLSGGALTQSPGAAEVRVKELEQQVAHSAENAEMRGALEKTRRWLGQGALRLDEDTCLVEARRILDEALARPSGGASPESTDVCPVCDREGGQLRDSETGQAYHYLCWASANV